MNRRSFSKSIGGALCALSINLGFVTKVLVVSRWKFKTKTILADKNGFPQWLTTITQYPSELDFDKLIGMPYMKDCFQYSFAADSETFSKEDCQRLSGQVILERKYELSSVN